MLAQLDSVPADFIKNTLLILMTLGALGFGWWQSKQKRDVKIEPQPLETRTAPKRYNHDLAEQRYAEITRRLEEQDAAIVALQQSFQDELAKVRTELVEIERRLNASSEERADKTHNRVNQILEAVAELRGVVQSKTK